MRDDFWAELNPGNAINILHTCVINRALKLKYNRQANHTPPMQPISPKANCIIYRACLEFKKKQKWTGTHPFQTECSQWCCKIKRRKKLDLKERKNTQESLSIHWPAKGTQLFFPLPERNHFRIDFQGRGRNNGNSSNVENVCVPFG